MIYIIGFLLFSPGCGGVGITVLTTEEEARSVLIIGTKRDCLSRGAEGGISAGLEGAGAISAGLEGAGAIGTGLFGAGVI